MKPIPLDYTQKLMLYIQDGKDENETQLCYCGTPRSFGEGSKLTSQTT